MRYDLLIRGGEVVDPGGGHLGRLDVAVDRGQIAAVDAHIPESAAFRVIAAAGQLVTPGLVDCHTHAVFGGDRGAEFEMRAAGRTYQEIQAAGGGIAATLETRNARISATSAPSSRASISRRRSGEVASASTDSVGTSRMLTSISACSRAHATIDGASPCWR